MGRPAGALAGRRAARVQRRVDLPRLRRYAGAVTDSQSEIDGLRDDLRQLVKQLIEDRPRSRRQTVAPLIRAHLGIGEDATGLSVYSEELEAWELPNLQLAIEAMLAREGWDGQLLGLGGRSRHFGELSLASFVVDETFGPPVRVGPVEYVNVPVGPGRTLACVQVAVLLLSTPDGSVAALVQRGEEHTGSPALAVEAASPVEGLAQLFLEGLRESMAEHDVYRGQVISVEVGRHGSQSIAFLERADMQASDLVLPDGVLERIESHILAPTEHRDQLLQSGRHMARGLLLWGPPGTGKTHTVRYLTGRLRDATIIILSGGSLGMIAGFGSLARRLTPSVVVLEDVDLVAQERDYGPYGGGPLLFELMNQMSGLADDADVAFVLTTNRPDVLEPALAARPGRVDLAVELPLPDAAARRRLIELYSRGLDLAVDDMDAVVRRTDGVTASFIKELLRKATLAAASHGRTQVSDQDMRSALDELMHATSTLTRALLGMPADGSETGGFAPYPAEPGIRVVSRGQTSRVWLQAFSDDEDG